MQAAVIAIVNPKGGVGKTTTAVAFAHSFTLDGHRTVVVDLDAPQFSATAWGTVATDLDQPLGCDFAPIPGDVSAAKIPRLIRQGSADYAVAIVDTPPGNLDRVAAAIEAATEAAVGAVIIPTGTHMPELVRAVNIAADIDDVPVYALLTRTRAVTRSRVEARENLTAAGLTVLDQEIPLREAIGRAMEGRPSLDTLQPYRDALHEVMDLAEIAAAEREESR